jgi:replicative DNA helicase
MSIHNEIMPPTGAAILSQLAPELLAAEALSRSRSDSGKAAGPISGFHLLDAAMNGFLAVGLHTLLAAPGVGKTAFALQIAAQCGTPALYVTAEMSRLDLMRRVIARTSRTFTGKLSGGTFSTNELGNLIETAIKAAPSLAFLDATVEPVNAAAIVTAAEDLKAHFGSEHVLIVIDSVTDWAASNAGGAPEYQATEAALTALKQISARLSCPVLGIAHKNRNAQGKEENLHSGKGTGRFEYVSESLWSLDPVEEKNNETAIKKPVILTLAKNRHGIRGAKVKFDFEGRLMEFVQSGGLIQ